MSKPDYKWHQLDGGLAYMSVQLGEGNTFQVLTTPVSSATYQEHQKLLEDKIEGQRLQAQPKG